MPQFDIASFYPQITFFAGIFLTFYVFLCKSVLPKVSQNLKLNKRMAEAYGTLATKGLKDLCLLSHIYKPSKIVSHLVLREVLCLICLDRFVSTITIAYMSYLN